MRKADAQAINHLNKKTKIHMSKLNK